MSRKGFDINEWLTPENKTRIRGWCLDGLIDKQIYKNMGRFASNILNSHCVRQERI